MIEKLFVKLCCWLSGHTVTDSDLEAMETNPEHKAKCIVCQKEIDYKKDRVAVDTSNMNGLW